MAHENDTESAEAEAYNHPKDARVLVSRTGPADVQLHEKQDGKLARIDKKNLALGETGTFEENIDVL